MSYDEPDFSVSDLLDENGRLRGKVAELEHENADLLARLEMSDELYAQDIGDRDLRIEALEIELHEMEQARRPKLITREVGNG